MQEYMKYWCSNKNPFYPLSIIWIECKILLAKNGDTTTKVSWKTVVGVSKVNKLIQLGLYGGRCDFTLW